MKNSSDHPVALRRTMEILRNKKAARFISPLLMIFVVVIGPALPGILPPAYRTGWVYAGCGAAAYLMLLAVYGAYLTLRYFRIRRELSKYPLC